MKKSFLQAFVVLCIFCVFFIGGEKNSYAFLAPAAATQLTTPKTVEKVFVKADPQNEWTTRGGKTMVGITEYYKVDGKDVKYVTYREKGSNDDYQRDYYSSLDSKDPINQGTTIFPSVQKEEIIKKQNAEQIAREQQRAAAGQAGAEENFVTNALQTFLLSWAMYGSKAVAWLVELVGIGFDYAITYTTQYPAQLDKAIKDAWTIIRDFSNIIIVFSLLYLGIKTILDGQGFADKKILVGILISAVLINFSFVFVKDIAFDTSNYLGRQILAQTGAQIGGTQASGSNPNSPSVQLMKLVNPQQVLDINNFKGEWNASNVAENDRTDWGMVWRIMGQMILFTFVVVMLALIFLGLSIMLLYRFVIFIILMVSAPFGFISLQIPWLQKQGKEWFEHLKKQTIFFPAFMLCLYLVLLIVTTLASQTNATAITDVGASMIFLFIFNFVLIAGFLIALMILPGKMSFAGAEFMGAAGNWTKGKIKSAPRWIGKTAAQRTGQVAASATARTGRLVLGAGTNALVSGKIGNKLKALAQDENSGWRGRLARASLKGADGVKNSSFDIRNTKIGSKLAAGKGIESYTKAVETKTAKIKEREEKEKKMFGFDRPELTEEQKRENERKLIEAKAERDSSGDILENKKEELKAAQRRGAGVDEIARISEQIRVAQEALKTKEENVGKLMNVGQDKYLKLMQERRKRLIGRGTWSVTQAAALKKYEEEMKKKWKEEGKYTPESNRSRNNNTNQPPAILGPNGQPAGGNPSPQPPIILGPNGQPAGGSPTPPPIPPPPTP